MDEHMRRLVDAAAAAAQGIHRQELQVTGGTKAYKRGDSSESTAVVKYVLKTKMGRIAKAAYKDGILLLRPKGPSQVEINEGFLTSGPQELVLVIPYALETTVIQNGNVLEQVDGISIVPPRSAFWVEPRGSTTLLFVFETGVAGQPGVGTRVNEGTDKGEEIDSQDKVAI